MNIKIIDEKVCTPESRLNKSKKFLAQRMKDLIYMTM